MLNKYSEDAIKQTADNKFTKEQIIQINNLLTLVFSSLQGARQKVSQESYAQH